MWVFLFINKRKTVLFAHGTIQATDDPIIPFTEAQKMQKYLPQADLVPIESATHYIPLEEGSWQKVADNLVAFLSSWGVVTVVEQDVCHNDTRVLIIVFKNKATICTFVHDEKTR